MSSRRDALSTISLRVAEHPNAGLWLDKFITSLSKEDKGSHSALADEVTHVKEPADYLAIYQSWEDSIKKLDADCRKARVKNRMAVGLGADGVLETSVMLHRTYGVPYIPGSALKGLAAAFARHHCGADWQQGKPFYEIVFGTTGAAGYITFFDALYVPGSGHEQKPLYFDVMTVHHRDYYAGKDKPPADWDDPNPVPFISATGEYLIALASPEGCEEWLDVAFEILSEALKHEGVGSKTSSGYGRLQVDPPPVDPSELEVESLLLAIKSIPGDKLPSELGQQAGKLLNSQLSNKQLLKVAELIQERVDEGGSKRRKRFEERPWFVEMQKLLNSK